MQKSFQHIPLETFFIEVLEEHIHPEVEEEKSSLPSWQFCAIQKSSAAFGDRETLNSVVSAFCLEVGKRDGVIEISVIKFDEGSQKMLLKESM